MSSSSSSSSLLTTMSATTTIATLLLLIMSSSITTTTHAFLHPPTIKRSTPITTRITPSLHNIPSRFTTSLFTSSSPSSSSTTTPSSSLPTAITQLKKILTREYTTFFSPMYTSYYSPTVSFNDPLTSLTGVESYRNNVDMLAGRTLLGKILFDDAGIVLHSVTGGDVREDGSVEDVITRWTLRVTVKVLPWKPTARFTGISVYKISPTTPNTEQQPEIQIDAQYDYWDSINIQPNSSGNYAAVEKSRGVSDFLNQLQPNSFNAQSAGVEVPYELLRRGDGYDVRRYPAVVVASLPYMRRDEGFGSLGAFTRGMSPLSPAIMTIPPSSTSNKLMSWILSHASPSSPTTPPPIPSTPAGEGQWRTVSVATIPSRTVAIREFNDASMEPVVRKADRELRELLKRDGLKEVEEKEEGEEKGLMFAQYDAVFSMGKRRGEVWIELEDGGHPW